MEKTQKALKVHSANVGKIFLSNLAQSKAEY
jgi:hypothetical protein